MNNHVIDAKQMKYAIALFYIGSSAVAGTTANSQQDSWIALLLGMVMLFPFLFVYGAILKLYPGQNFFDIIVHVFGNIAGKILCGLYVFYALHLGGLNLYTIALFVQTVNMPETPAIFIIWCVVFPCIYMVYKGAKVMGNIAHFFYPIVAITVLFTVIFSIKNMNVQYLFPMMNTDFSALMDSSTNTLSLPMGEIVLPLALFSYDSKVKYTKILFQSVILGTAILLVANLRNLLILGPAVRNMFPFASYIAVSVLAIGEFLTRAEVLIGLNLMIGGFFKTIICYFVACIGLAKIFNEKEYKQFAIPVSLLMIAFNLNVFSNSMESQRFVSIYKYCAMPLQFILPVIILIVGEAKMFSARLNAAAKSNDRHDDNNADNHSKEQTTE